MAWGRGMVLGPSLEMFIVRLRAAETRASYACFAQLLLTIRPSFEFTMTRRRVACRSITRDTRTEAS
jgi:hypothetical protein